MRAVLLLLIEDVTEVDLTIGFVIRVKGEAIGAGLGTVGQFEIDGEFAGGSAVVVLEGPDLAVEFHHPPAVGAWFGDELDRVFEFKIGEAAFDRIGRRRFGGTDDAGVGPGLALRGCGGGGDGGERQKDSRRKAEGAEVNSMHGQFWIQDWPGGSGETTGSAMSISFVTGDALPRVRKANRNVQFELLKQEIAEPEYRLRSAEHCSAEREAFPFHAEQCSALRTRTGYSCPLWGNHSTAPSGRDNKAQGET